MTSAMASFHMTEEQRKSLDAICHRFDVARLELFGSATTDSFIPERSDLDFLVEFIANADLGPWMTNYFDLKDTLERLFGRPVDLVFNSALKNPYFIRRVNLATHDLSLKRCCCSAKQYAMRAMRSMPGCVWQKASAFLGQRMPVL